VQEARQEVTQAPHEQQLPAKRHIVSTLLLELGSNYVRGDIKSDDCDVWLASFCSPTGILELCCLTSVRADITRILKQRLAHHENI
jgi:hypothetical protein